MVDDAVPRQALIEMAKSGERPKGRKKKLHVATLSGLGINKMQKQKSHGATFERTNARHHDQTKRATQADTVARIGFSGCPSRGRPRRCHRVGLPRCRMVAEPPAAVARQVHRDHETPPRWSGNCFATDVYSMKWPIDCIAPRFRPLMEAQVVIELAGGVAEAVFRGEQRKHAILAFAVSNCAIDADLTRAAAVLSELRRLTGVRHDAQPFAERALRLTLANWCLHFEIRKGSTPVDPTQYLGGA